MGTIAVGEAAPGGREVTGQGRFQEGKGGGRHGS
jgi:hypothetical protein